MLMNIAQDGDVVITNFFVRAASFFQKMQFTPTSILLGNQKKSRISCS